MPMAKREPEPERRDLQHLDGECGAVTQVQGNQHCHVELAPDQQVLEIVAVVLDRRTSISGQRPERTYRNLMNR
jgi:hypothetical protein